MTLPVYPALVGLALPVKWTPRFYNMATQTTASGADIDLGLAEYPLHDFELQYEFLRDSGGAVEFKTLMGFVLQNGGAKGRFLFSNPDDKSVTAQGIGTGDGTTTAFTLVRSFGAGGFAGIEPVGMADLTATFNVYVDGTLQTLTTDYTIDQTTAGANTVNFVTAPASGAAITVDMTYFYYCKFPDDAEEFDKFMANLWSMSKIMLHSCRPGA
jgi:uncharacterized protein (TIGR02217 family)